MPRPVQRDEYVDGSGQRYFFSPLPELIDERDEETAHSLFERLDPDKYQQVMNYVARQTKLAPDRKMTEILDEMTTVPEGEEEYLHPGFFGLSHAKQALRLIADRIQNKEKSPGIGQRLETAGIYQRLEHGLSIYGPSLDGTMESLIERPEYIDSLDFMVHHGRTDEGDVDRFLKRQLREALSIRDQEQPEDPGLHAALNRLPFPKLERSDVEVIRGIIG